MFQSFVVFMMNMCSVLKKNALKLLAISAFFLSGSFNGYASDKNSRLLNREISAFPNNGGNNGMNSLTVHDNRNLPPVVNNRGFSVPFNENYGSNITKIKKTTIEETTIEEGGVKETTTTITEVYKRNVYDENTYPPSNVNNNLINQLQQYEGINGFDSSSSSSDKSDCIKKNRINHNSNGIEPRYQTRDDSRSISPAPSNASEIQSEDSSDEENQKTIESAEASPFINSSHSRNTSCDSNMSSVNLNETIEEKSADQMMSENTNTEIVNSERNDTPQFVRFQGDQNNKGLSDVISKIQDAWQTRSEVELEKFGREMNKEKLDNTFKDKNNIFVIVSFEPSANLLLQKIFEKTQMLESSVSCLPEEDKQVLAALSEEDKKIIDEWLLTESKNGYNTFPLLNKEAIAESLQSILYLLEPCSVSMGKGSYGGKTEDNCFISIKKSNYDVMHYIKIFDKLSEILCQESYIYVNEGVFYLRYPDYVTKNRETTIYDWVDETSDDYTCIMIPWYNSEGKLVKFRNLYLQITFPESK